MRISLIESYSILMGMLDLKSYLDDIAINFGIIVAKGIMCLGAFLFYI